MLIIDEISMIDGDLFDKLEEIGKKLRCSIYDPKPFGGLQLVLSGAWFRLLTPRRSCSAPVFMSSAPLARLSRI